MACKKVKEKKQELKEDEYINDPRYTALNEDVRVAFKKYLSLKKDGSLTDFLAKRKIIDDKAKTRGNGIEGRRILETGDDGSIQTIIMKKNGEID